MAANDPGKVKSPSQRKPTHASLPRLPLPHITCRLLPLLIKQVSRTDGGTCRKPLQPSPGFILDKTRRKETLGSKNHEQFCRKNHRGAITAGLGAGMMLASCGSQADR